MREKPLVAMALAGESRGQLEAAGADVVYTGLGKVNAASGLMRELWRRRAAGQPVSGVLNLGTAGSHVHAAGALIECTRFVQHDMDVSPLGFPIGHTPFETDLPATLEVARQFAALAESVCHSGDRFVAGPVSPRMPVIDMEAYALAKVALREGLTFACVKFISDGANGQAAADWPQTLERASRVLAELYRQHHG